MAKDLTVDDRADVPGGRPRVRLAVGDDASGMAVMLGELLTDNLRDYPGRARAARFARGSVALCAADHDRSVSIRFTGEEIVIEEGAAHGAPVLTGKWSDLAQLCSGRLGPFHAVRSGRLDMSDLHRPDLLAAAGYVLSVPASYYGETPWWRQRRVLVPVVLVLLGFATAALMAATARTSAPVVPTLRAGPDLPRHR